ncbi:hypothetical protein [Tenacibaculum amylolyticum]|uniref:hypothetical protein n=1 Tax=Tenacibaculum amylolyticum TaxID=104269 RepID=UPI0038961CFF
MKKWKISQSEGKTKYLITEEKLIWLLEVNSEENVDKLVADREFSKADIIRYEDLEELIFIDTDSALQFEFKDTKADEITLDLDIDNYEEIKKFFLSNLKGVEIKDYSLLKQAQPLGFGVLVSGFLTTVLYLAAVRLASGEAVNSSGRRNLFKKILVIVADFLGPIGSLVVGGLITLLFIYGLFRVIKNPKKGKLVKTKGFTEMKF